MDRADAVSRLSSSGEIGTNGGWTSCTLYDFFAGRGLVHLGFGDGRECIWAVASDKGKAAAYKVNFGPAGLRHGDVPDVQTSIIPGVFDLAWASSPCQDVSVAKARKGLAGAARGASRCRP